MKMDEVDQSMMNSTDEDINDENDVKEVDWSSTYSELFSEEVQEEKEKFKRSNSNSSETANFDLESWLAANLPMLSSSDRVNKAEFGWRLPGSSHCSWPGPLIRLQRGQRHGLLVKGAPGTKTNIHFHGLHIAGDGNGDNMMRVIDGNDVLVYSLDIPEYHMGGTHWYHSHLHGETQNQVGGGAFGLLIVDDGHDFGSTDPNVLEFMKRELKLVVDNRKGRWMANGLVTDTFQLNPNEWYRMRILAVNTDAYTVGETIHFGDACQVHAIAHDGILRFQVPEGEARSDFMLSTSSRLDVAVRCQDSSTISVGSQKVVTIQVLDLSKANSVELSTATPFDSENQVWNSTRPRYLSDLRDLEVANRWKLHLDEVDINHQSWYLQRPLCDDRGKDFEYNSIQEWSVTGLESHPLHVHTYPMQVVSDDGCGSGHAVGEFYDTLAAHGNMKVSRNCKVRLRLSDVAGPTVVQSHTLQHSDQGSIGILHVVGGPESSQDPHVFRCAKENCDEPESIITCGEW
jgi:FtsP/CotA-like multicopper oxidase with cupredoxin domain